jgi:hypothetical protein
MGTRFAASLRTDNSPQRKEARPLSHQHLDSSALGLVRRWLLIGCFPLLCNPPSQELRRQRWLLIGCFPLLCNPPSQELRRQPHAATAADPLALAPRSTHLDAKYLHPTPAAPAEEEEADQEVEREDFKRVRWRTRTTAPKGWTGASSPYSDEKVANREISQGLARGDREWLLNGGQIQNPSAQS